MKKILKIVLVLMTVMVYAVSKVQRIHNKSEAVSKALKRAEYQKVINTQTTQEVKTEIKSKNN